MENKIKEKLLEVKTCALNVEETRQLRISQLIAISGIPLGFMIGFAGYKNLRILGFNSIVGKVFLFTGCSLFGVSSISCVTCSLAMIQLKKQNLPLTKTLYELDGLLGDQIQQLQSF